MNKNWQIFIGLILAIILIGLISVIMVSKKAGTVNTSDEVSAHFLPAGAPESGGIVDMALIYHGNARRLDWNKKQLSPHVSWLNPETNTEEWLFDTFLFIEFKDPNGDLFAKGYRGEPAKRTVFEWFLNRIFEKGVAVDALNELLGETASRIGPPSIPRKVILTIPEPISGYKNWGELNGKPVDFDVQADRIAVAKWFIDNLMERWQEAGFDHLELAGFYWVAEEMGDNDIDLELMQATGKYIRELGKRFYWIPWWQAPGSGEWKNLSFDAAYQQPNHFFRDTIPQSRLDKACAFAKEHNMGMEMEWDARIWKDKENFLPRMQAYLDVFENAGVIKNASMAHYMDNGGLYDLFMKIEEEKDEDLRNIFNRYCSIIAGRQRTFGITGCR